MKNTTKTSASKEKNLKILRKKSTKILFDKAMYLSEAIVSLEENAFSHLNETEIKILNFFLSCKHALIYYSQETIAKLLNIKRRETVNKTIKLLSKMGILIWNRRYNCSNLYRLHDIIYTYQFRQAFKHIFSGLNHPSFYALLPAALRGITKKITLIVKSYHYDNVLKNKVRRNKGPLRPWVTTLLGHLAAGPSFNPKKEENNSENKKSRGNTPASIFRNQRLINPTPRAAAPPSQTLEELLDEYAQRAGIIIPKKPQSTEIIRDVDAPESTLRSRMNERLGYSSISRGEPILTMLDRLLGSNSA